MSVATDRSRRLTVPVPPVVAQLPLYFQAYDAAGCATSNVVAFTFP